MSELPLQDVRIIDLSRVLAGPFATQILGDLGAEVLKIESANGDDTRSWAPPYFDNNSVYYLSANRNKKSFVLDLSTPRDLAKLNELIGTADALVENFKTGSLKKFGLDYNSLQARHPGLIYCSISGFGRSGPRATSPGYDALIQAMGGLMSITGTAEDPYKVGVAVTDLTTGLYAVIGILAALHERQKSNMGQHIDLALLDSQVSILSHRAMDYLATGSIPRPVGNSHANIVPYQSFVTADGPIFLAVGNDSQFAQFCAILGQSWHHDVRFSTNPQRVQNRVALVDLIIPAIRAVPRDKLLLLFEQCGVPAAPINDIAQLARDPQVLARELFTTMEDGKTPCIRSPLRFSRTPIKRYRVPPGLGENQGDLLLPKSPDSP